MEKDSGFGYHQHPYLMSPNRSLLDFSIDTGHLYTQPVCENPRSESTSRNAPLFPFFGLQHSNANEPNYSQNRLYDMPHFYNAYPPVFNSAPKEKFPIFNFGQHKSPTTDPTTPQKRFLVFDQSDNKTTLFYSSGAHTPVQFRASWVPNLPTAYNLTKEELRVISNPLRPSMNDGNIEDEMHEDTEELDALLCSDGDFSEDDDEETSTGHLPSTKTYNIVRDLVEEIGEEVDSFVGATKRHKISDKGYNNNVPPPSNGPVAISLKMYAGSMPEDDAESFCGDVNYKWCKRSRREKVHETLRALRSVIPNGNGKDAVVVIDEAIQYLRSLKVEMKALGLDAL